MRWNIALPVLTPLLRAASESFSPLILVATFASILVHEFLPKVKFASSIRRLFRITVETRR